MDYLNKYEDFLLKNASQITSIESSLRSLTYILPGRFHDAEFASQALYAALNLVGLYHTSILKKAVLVHANSNNNDNNINNNTTIEESAFNKYLSYCTSKSKLTSVATTLLSVISYTQVLLEMAILKKWGKKKQWLGITYLETLKFILRLILFQSTQQRMTLQPTHLQRDVDPSQLNKKEEDPIYHQQLNWTGQRSGMKIPLLASTIDLNNGGIKLKGAYNDVTDYLLSKVLTPEKLRKPEQMVQIQRNYASKMGEILYIARPLIYVLSILLWGRKSWRPWMISLIIELTSQLAIRKGYQGRSGRTTMLALEKQEYNRRLKWMLLNVMRGAFYIKVTRPRLERFCNATETKPVLSILSGVLRDYLSLWQDIYFYTSAS